MSDQPPPYKELMQQWQQFRRQSLEFAAKFFASGKVLFGARNVASASTQAILATFTEWRLGSDDPTPYFRQAVQDARQLVQYFDKVEGLNERSGHMLVIRDAMYGQLLLGEPIDAEFRQACFITPEEKCRPTMYKEYWIHPWDALVLQLVETGQTPEWDAFIAWLKDKGGGSNLIKTMQAYKLLIDSAGSGNAKAVSKAIADAERCYRARRNLYVTWGGVGLSDQMIDHRLACAIKKAEEIRPGSTQHVETPHRWRWS